MQIKVEFGGGAELLFDNKKQYDVTLPVKEKPYLIEEVLSPNKIRFLTANNIKIKRCQSTLRRPGILVLVNDTDWELMDTTSYEIQPNDSILFISTLHGG